jgi:hypothetical protein
MRAQPSLIFPLLLLEFHSDLWSSLDSVVPVSSSCVLFFLLQSMKGELLISSIVFLPKFGKLLLFLMSMVHSMMST